MASARPGNDPFTTVEEEFAHDDRIGWSKTASTYVLEEDGEEFTWNGSEWIRSTDDDDDGDDDEGEEDDEERLLRQQASIYRMEGVDENEPAYDPQKAKRKAEEMTTAAASKKPKKEHRNTAVYATGIPSDASKQEIADVFRKAGLITESTDTDEKRIVMYYDDHGNFKGDALIVYFKPESVNMAISFLDGYYFRAESKKPMKVMAADASHKAQKIQPDAASSEKQKNPNAFRDRKRAIRKNEEMMARLGDWGDDELPESLQGKETLENPFHKMVLAKRIFTPEEATDPEEMKDIRLEIMGEACKNKRVVTGIEMFDEEPEGIIVIRFEELEQAAEFAKHLNGHTGAGGRKIEASVMQHKLPLKKSALSASWEKDEHAAEEEEDEDEDEDDDDDDDEQARMEAAIRATQAKKDA